MRQLRETLVAMESAWLEPLERVGVAESAVVGARWLLRATVDEARAEGCSWEQIGSRLGISRQAAQQRFGHEEPPAG